MSKKKQLNTTYEPRSMKTEHRAFENENGQKSIEGYALLFNHNSRMIWDWFDGEFVERILPGALDEVLARNKLDVIMTTNHNYEKVIARTLSGTLKLEIDERGLKYKIDEVPNISYAQDLYESIKRGDTFESSFTFKVSPDDEDWSELEDGTKLRTIKKISDLKEVAPVTFAAYSNTDVAVRNYKIAFPDSVDHKEGTLGADDNDGTQVPNIEMESRKRKLSLLKLKK